MKRFLKRFIKLSWRGIPIGIIATALITTVVLAAVIITAVQTITQDIVEKPAPVEPEIVAAAIDLPNVYENHSFTWEAVAPVRVTSMVADRYLKLALADPSAYSTFSVELVLESKPAGSALVVGTTAITVDEGTLTGNLQLDVAGEYTFTETVAGVAGSAGSASIDLTLTLEDSL